MPRTSERAHVLEDIDAVIEIAACSHLLVSDEGGGIDVEEEGEEHTQDLLEVQEVIVAHRYLSRDTSAGRHEIDVLEPYIHEDRIPSIIPHASHMWYLAYLRCSYLWYLWCVRV